MRVHFCRNMLGDVEQDGAGLFNRIYNDVAMNAASKELGLIFCENSLLISCEGCGC